MRLIKPTKWPPRRAVQSGFTLIEMMISISIFTVVMGALFSISVSIGNAARVQDIEIRSSTEVRAGMQKIMRELRQASRNGISGVPGPFIRYQIPVDIDANKLAVNGDCNIELSTDRVIKRDIDDANCSGDANGDGLTGNQLVLVPLDASGAIIVEGVRVLANDLPDDEDTSQDGVLDEGDDTNNNGVLDHGIWFDTVGRRIEITVQSSGKTRQGHELVSGLTQSVFPRNG